MHWEITLNIPEKILYIKTFGILDIVSASEMRQQGAALIREQGLRACLLDHSDLSAYTLTSAQIYYLPARYRELGISHKFRMAVVVPAALKADLVFYETVCRNNGYMVSIFFDYDTAMGWLKA